MLSLRHSLPHRCSNVQALACTRPPAHPHAADAFAGQQTQQQGAEGDQGAAVGDPLPALAHRRPYYPRQWLQDAQGIPGSKGEQYGTSAWCMSALRCMNVSLLFRSCLQSEGLHPLITRHPAECHGSAGRKRLCSNLDQCNTSFGPNLHARRMNPIDPLMLKGLVRPGGVPNLVRHRDGAVVWVRHTPVPMHALQDTGVFHQNTCTPCRTRVCSTRTRARLAGHGCVPHVHALQDTGVFHQKAVSKSMQETMATDPSLMVDMMKKNLTGIVPQVCVNLLRAVCWEGQPPSRIASRASLRYRDTSHA